MNRKELVQSKYPEQFEEAVGVEDPSDNNKYLLWIAKQLKIGHNAADISATIRFFHENPARFEQKDIMKYKDLKTLEDIIKDMGLSKRQEKEKEKEGAEKIFEDDNFLVVRVDDKPAMILYGSNTKWCTTMKDQTYYEDYVCRGNDFYIIITKNQKAAKSSKYAVVRKGLLEFQVYDDKDTQARDFEDREIELLHSAVQAIVGDKPPKNFLRQVCKGEISAEDSEAWAKSQTEVTKEYIERYRPDIRFLHKSIAEIVGLFSNASNRPLLKSIGYDTITKIVEYIVNIKDTSLYPLKVDLIQYLQDQELMKLARDKDTRIRAKLVLKMSPEKAREFLNDKSIGVVKCAARAVDADYLIEFADKTTSSRIKKAAFEVIIERMSQDLVKKFVLSQPFDVIRTLME